MKAPPRSIPAPLAFTDLATEMICSRFSTEQGPAMIWKWSPPMGTPPQSTTESSSWNLRLALLKGSWMRLTPSTMSSEAIRSMSTRLVSPIRPMMVWCWPLEMCRSKPMPSSQLVRFFTCFSLTLSLSSMIMFVAPLRDESWEK